MSSTTGTRPASQPGGREGPAPSAGQEQSGGLGLTSATGLVIGSIIGTGVFTMPAVLAAAGTSSLIVLAVVGVGAMLLAIMFGQLTKRVPKADGGLYAYARHEFGDFAGYVTAWSYWISSWGGNAAIVASWVFYVDALFSISHPSAMANWGIALVGLWVPAAVNLAGVRQMAWFQNITVVLKFVPLLFVGVVGWFFVRSANFGPFNASGGSLYSCIGIAALNGWTLVTTECSRAPADDGLFPKAFAWNDRNGTAWFGIVIAALLPSLLMLWRYTSSSGLTVFTYLVDLTVVTVAVPYLFSACAQLTYLVSRRRRVQGWLLA